MTVPSATYANFSYSYDFTLHGCDTTGGTVTAELLRGGSVAATDTQYVSVTAPPPDPEISITGLVTQMEEGQSDSFTVSASDLVSSNSYTIRVTTNNSDIGFNSSCSDRQEDVTVPSGRTSYSTTLTLYGCDTFGGTVTATLRRGSTTVDTETQYVSVTAPPPDPEISITGLVTQMEEGGASDSFTVTASDLVSSNSYTIRVTTNNSDIGFNSSCSDRQEDVTVPSGRTSYSTTLTLYGCDTFGGTVTATLRRGSTTVDTDTQYVSVTAPPPDPEISITGLVTQMEEGGASDSFTVTAADLVSSNSYTIRVTTSNSDIGFNSSCSDRQEDVTVPSGRTSYSTTLTLYGCDTFGGTVTATLRRGSTTVDTDTQYVSVTAPPPDPEISITGLVTQMEEGQSDSFTVSASDLVSSNSYTIRVTTNNSDIGFNSSCSDRQEDVTVPSGRTSYSTTLTLYGCDTFGGTVTATLRRGSTTVDTETQYVSVTTPPPDPEISITGFVTQMEEGQSDSFTVSASDLVSSNDYTIRVTTNNSDIGFNSSCSDAQEDTTVTSGSTSYSGTFTLYGCDTSGGTVTATLRRGSTIVDTATQVVTVKEPSVSITGLVTQMEDGQSDSFTVSASDLASSNDYTIRVTTSNSDIGFETGCSNIQKVAIVPDTSTSHSATFTLYGCAVTSGTVTATLLRGSTIVDTATQSVTVKNQSIVISGLLTHIEEGGDDEFVVTASSLVSSNRYTIQVATSNSDIGFETGCSNVQKVAIVPDTSTSHSATFTLYGCDVTAGTVTATLIRSGAVVATDTFGVTVKPPIFMSLDSFLSPPVIVEGRSHEFRVLTYNTVPGRTYRVMTSVDPSGTTVAGFNSGCTDNSRNSSTFDGTASEVASSFTLWACNATTTTMTLWVQLQVQDPGGTTWSDFGPFDEEFSVLSPPAISIQQNFGDILENSFKMIDIPMAGNPAASRLRLRVDESGGRAYVVEVMAERSMGDPVRVNRITVHTDSPYSEPPDYQYLGGNQAVWIAPSPAPADDRQVVLEVVKPLLGSGVDLTGYKVTISEPNVALIERPTPTLSGLVVNSTTGEATAGSVYLPLRVRNSSASLAGARVSVVCSVDRGGTRIGAGRSHGTFFVGAGPNETDLAVTSICQGIVLQQGDEISLTAEVAQGDPIHKHSVHATGTVAWEHDMASTLFHSHSSHLMGGLQINAGGSACTSSFTLTLLDLSNSPATDYEAISTTEHCAEHLRHDWYQGPIPTSTAQYIADTTVVAAVTPCNLLIPLDTSTTSTEAMNCTIGDQSYGEEVAAAGATFDHGFIFKPGSGFIANSDALHRPKIQYFTGVASTTRFRIDSARPPYDMEMVHKVGRTAGWTFGRISRPPGLEIRDKDPTCPGGYVDAGFNTRKDGDDTYTECQSYTLMAVARGDSGSPVFSRIGTTDDVVLVGVLFSQTEDKGIFIPIDRVYAESLKQGFDWDTSQQQLRPIPAPIGITPTYETFVGTTTLSVKATFRKRDFSPSLYYEADFLREGAPPTEVAASCYVTTPERTQLGYSGHDDRNADNGNNCTVATSTLNIFGLPTDTVEVSFHGLDADMAGTFSVKLRACKETAAVSPSSPCGGYGTNGNQTVTLAR